MPAGTAVVMGHTGGGCAECVAGYQVELEKLESECFPKDGAQHCSTNGSSSSGSRPSKSLGLEPTKPAGIIPASKSPNEVGITTTPNGISTSAFGISNYFPTNGASASTHAATADDSSSVPTRTQCFSSAYTTFEGHGTQQHVSWFSVDVCMPLPGTMFADA